MQGDGAGFGDCRVAPGQSHPAGDGHTGVREMGLGGSLAPQVPASLGAGSLHVQTVQGAVGVTNWPCWARTWRTNVLFSKGSWNIM